MTWNSGCRASDRAGASSSTSRSNGTSWWANAARSVSRTRASTSPERRVAGQVGAQHQGVDEEPDQVVERLVGAAGDRRADRDVGAGAQPRQQHRERGLQHHEHGHALGPGQLDAAAGAPRPAPRTAPACPRWLADAGRGRSAGSASSSGAPASASRQ